MLPAYPPLTRIGFCVCVAHDEIYMYRILELQKKAEHNAPMIVAGSIEAQTHWSSCSMRTDSCRSCAVVEAGRSKLGHMGTYVLISKMCKYHLARGTKRVVYR